jgi:hypothetical protein
MMLEQLSKIPDSPPSPLEIPERKRPRFQTVANIMLDDLQSTYEKGQLPALKDD